MRLTFYKTVIRDEIKPWQANAQLVPAFAMKSLMSVW